MNAVEIGNLQRILIKYGIKWCRCCGEFKPLWEFAKKTRSYLNIIKAADYHCHCKECVNHQQRARYKTKTLNGFNYHTPANHVYPAE
jgi:hypothetical protein